MESLSLANSEVLKSADVSRAREVQRRSRLVRLAVVVAVIGAIVTLFVTGVIGWDVSAPHWLPTYAPAIALLVVLLIGVAVPFIGSGRSPHILYRPEQTGIGLSDVKGASVVVEEVVKTLNLFLAHKTFRDQMGGNPRRAVLFEGPPGTGKTYIAKAMAAEANVPFLFVSSTAFQSHFYGMTGRKIRSYFNALRKYARKEGGAIGFIEEIDAIGAARHGIGNHNGEGIAGVVNELLIQLQSFDEPTRSERMKGWFIDQINAWLPASRTLKKPVTQPANVLVIGATNRAADLDQALMRPGRFDRTITVDLPGRADRREIVDYYLDRKRHAPELDVDENRDTLAATTMGYSPVMIEHLLDEALVWALRRGSDRLSWEDLQRAKMTTELGLAQPTAYADTERRRIATHEAGHAVTAWLVAPERKLEVLSIIKRSVALGLLSHSEPEERWTRTQPEIEALIRIAMGGMVAEERFFGDISSGVAGDLKAATDAAAQMIGSFGMAGSLVSLEAVQGAGNMNLVAKVLSDEASRQKLDGILDVAADDVRALIGSHHYLVEALRDALLEREELIGPEIEDALLAAAAAHSRPVVDLRDVAGPGTGLLVPPVAAAEAHLTGPPSPPAPEF